MAFKDFTQRNDDEQTPKPPETVPVQEPVDSVEHPGSGDGDDSGLEFTWTLSHAGGGDDDDIDDEPTAGDDGGKDEEGETVQEPVDSVEHPGSGKDDDGKDDDSPEL